MVLAGDSFGGFVVVVPHPFLSRLRAITIPGVRKFLINIRWR
jgi:hypothetical protein